jgi:hypothetical protein
MNPNVRRTSLYLDMTLLDEARAELGTKTMTDTIHAALREIARRAALQRLAEWDFSHLPPDWHQQIEEDWDALEHERDRSQ